MMNALRINEEKNWPDEKFIHEIALKKFYTQLNDDIPAILYDRKKIIINI
jgi:hypothetical protein